MAGSTIAVQYTESDPPRAKPWSWSVSDPDRENAVYAEGWASTEGEAHEQTLAAWHRLRAERGRPT